MNPPNVRQRAAKWSAMLIIAAWVGAHSLAAHAQSCPSGSTYYSEIYNSECTGGSCWAQAPFQGSQSAAPLGFPTWYYSCTTPPAAPPPPAPPAAPSGRLYEFGYDDQGNVTLVKNPLNHPTNNQYDVLNRLQQVTDAATGVTHYGYNGLDALISVIDPRTLQTTYAVTGLGNLDQQVSPDTGTTVNTYDTAGNLLTQTDAKSQVTTYAYDALNRVTSITFHDGSSQTYVYDQGLNGIGRLSSITERNAAAQIVFQTAYGYSQHGRITSDTRTINGVSYTVGYGYDTFGRLETLTYPSGRTVTYEFDTLGRIKKVTTTKNGETHTVVKENVLYYPFGGVEGYTLGNDRGYTRSIDLDGRISTYTLGAKTFAVGYDAANRVEFISQTTPPQNPPNSNTNNYVHDSLDRLTTAMIPGTTYVYGYDAVGNRSSRTAGAGTDTYHYSTTSNRITSIDTASSGTRSFTFDNTGSTTADGINTYVYDVRGRMKQSTGALGVTNYQINALGQRIRKTGSAVDRVFHYDTDGRLIAESDASGSTKRELIYLGEIPVGVVQ